MNDLKVMVIDDSKTIRRTAENLLKKEGCEVVISEPGFLGSDCVKNFVPHAGLWAAQTNLSRKL